MSTPPTPKEMLDNVNTAIDARMTGGAVESYSIAGRNLQYISIDELVKLRSRLRQEVSSGTSRTSYAEFRRPAV